LILYLSPERYCRARPQLNDSVVTPARSTRGKAAFGYWFDFGDDWWHQINVVATEDAAPRGKYPKVTKRVGKSPPQYVGWDEEQK